MPDHPFPDGASDSATAHGFRMISRYVAQHHPSDEEIGLTAKRMTVEFGADTDALTKFGIWLRGDLQENGSEPLDNFGGGRSG